MSLRHLFLIVLCFLLPGACSKPSETAATPANPSKDKETFRHQLEGTTWLWGNGSEAVTFGPDGKFTNPGWDARGLATRWIAVDRRTVLLIVDKGRDNDRYAVLTFAEDLSEYDGYDFHNATLLPKNHQK